MCFYRRSVPGLPLLVGIVWVVPSVVRRRITEGVPDVDNVPQAHGELSRCGKELFRTITNLHSSLHQLVDASPSSAGVEGLTVRFQDLLAIKVSYRRAPFHPLSGDNLQEVSVPEVGEVQIFLGLGLHMQIENETE
jgi:hypothetical protein